MVKRNEYLAFRQQCGCDPLRSPNRPDGEIGRHKGLKIPRLETAVPVRLRLRAPVNKVVTELLLDPARMRPIPGILFQQTAAGGGSRKQTADALINSTAP